MQHLKPNVLFCCCCWWKLHSIPTSKGWDDSAGKVLDWKARCSNDAGLIPIPGIARDFFPKINFQCRFSLGVCTTPTCAIANMNMYVHIKNPKHWHPCLDTRKYCTHWQKWVALLLRCSTQVRRPKFPARDNKKICFYRKKTRTRRWDCCSPF